MFAFELKELFSKMNSCRLQTEQAIRKSQNGELRDRMREMRRIRVEMRGMGWECGCGELAWEWGKSG